MTELDSISYEDAVKFGDPVANGEVELNHDYSVHELCFNERPDRKSFYQISWNTLKEVQFSEIEVLNFLTKECHERVICIWHIKPISHA